MLGSRRTPLALLLLTADRPHLALAAARVAFAVVLMFSQMGFLLGVDDSQNAILDSLDADLVVLSKARYNLFIDEEFPRARLYQARTVPGVQSASPLYIGGLRSTWRAPGTGREYYLRVLAVRPDDPVFLDAGLQRQLGRLKEDDAALFDARSRDFLGRVEPGTWAELNRRRVRVVGTFQLGPDYRNDGNAIISDTNLVRYFPEAWPDQPSLGLIRLRPGADPSAVAGELARSLPPDVDILTKADLARREADYWDSQTPIGIVFGFGLVLGFVVGMLTCYQILHADVKVQLPQFAALKAMGWHEPFPGRRRDV